METVEILAGGEFANAVKSLGLTSAVCTYHYQPQPTHWREEYQVWLLSKEDFDNICAIDNDDWKDDWGWWRHAYGSNLADGKPFVCPHPSDVCPRPSDSAEALTIKVRYLSDKIQPLEYIDGKSDWVDLRAAEDVELKAGEFKLIPLGIAMQLPKGYEAIVAPRSSTYKNFGIRQTNSIGVIDETYCGDNDQWYFPARADRHTVIHVGDRICQFRIEKHQPQLFFESVDTLGNADRGGIGSTGKR